MASHDRRGDILGSVIAVTAAAFISLLLRVFVRLKMVKMLAWDDIVMIAAMVVCLGAVVIVGIEVHLGHGQHFTEIPPAQIPQAIFYNFMTGPIYIGALAIVKVSIGLYLLRIAPTKLYRWLIYGFIAVNMIFGLMGVLEVCLQCRDIRSLWDQSIKTTCLPPTTLQAMSYMFSAVNIITDFFFALLPIPMLWHVQINAKTKASICCILGLGVFASAASVVKAVYIGSYKPGPDYLYDVSDLTIWTAVEVNMGIMAGCLPSLKPLFSRILATTMRSYPYGRSGASGGASGKRHKPEFSTGARSTGKPIPLQDRPSQPAKSREWYDTDHASGWYDDSEENLTTAKGTKSQAMGGPGSPGVSPMNFSRQIQRSTTVDVTVEMV